MDRKCGEEGKPPSKVGVEQRKATEQGDEERKEPGLEAVPVEALTPPPIGKTVNGERAQLETLAPAVVRAGSATLDEVSARGVEVAVSNPVALE